MLLAIDTCGGVGGVALGELCADPSSQNRDPSTSSGQALGHPGLWFRELAGKTYSELLLPTVDDLLREADATLEEITGVVVVRGPGSFTGIRIGVSAAKGLAEGLSVPLIALSRLELLARQSRGANAIAVLDAGRSEFYGGFYREGLCETEALLTRDALSQAVSGSDLPILVCQQEVFSVLAELQPRMMAAPTAVEALLVGAERFMAESFDDIATLEANYLRRSESEMLARIAEHAAQRCSEPATPAQRR